MVENAQQTVQQEIQFSGIGIHTGKPVKMCVCPTNEDHGIVFKRTDITDRDNLIPANAYSVTGTQLATSLTNSAGVSVMTIEHLLSALYALEIDNALIELTSQELPAMDGSSKPYTNALLKPGLKTQSKPARYIEVIAPFLFKEGDQYAEFLPSKISSLNVSIEFKDHMIGKQEVYLELTSENYCKEIAPARTFAFMEEIEQLQKAGFGLGGSLENAILVDKDKIVNPEGLRYKDEFVRHKTLDVIGDISLMQSRFRGKLKAHKTGHALNNKILRAFLADKTVWRQV